MVPDIVEKICWSEDFSCDAQLSSSRWRTRFETSWWEAPHHGKVSFNRGGASDVMMYSFIKLLELKILYNTKVRK